MARDKKFLANKPRIIEMLELGIPPSVMMEYFKDDLCFESLSMAALNKYIKRIKQEGDYKGEVLSIPNNRAHLFSLLMKKDVSYFVSSALERFFKLEELFSIIGYARHQLQQLNSIAFTSEVPDGYQQFIKFVYGYRDYGSTKKWEIRHLGEELFLDCLRAIKDGKKEMPTEKVLQNIYDLADFIIKDNDRMVRIREKIEPLLTSKVCDKVDIVLLTLTDREALVIRSLYGLNRTKRSHQEIGEELEMTAERVRQIGEKAIRRCRHDTRLSIIGLYTMNWQPIQEKMERLEYFWHEEKRKHEGEQIPYWVKIPNKD